MILEFRNWYIIIMKNYEVKNLKMFILVLNYDVFLLNKYTDFIEERTLLDEE